MSRNKFIFKCSEFYHCKPLFSDYDELTSVISHLLQFALVLDMNIMPSLHFICLIYSSTCIQQRENPSGVSHLQNHGSGVRTKVSGLSSQSEEDGTSSSEESASEDSDTGKGEQPVTKSDEQVDDSLSLRAEVMQVSVASLAIIRYSYMYVCTVSGHYIIIMEYGSTPYVGMARGKMAAACALYKFIRSELCSRYSHKPL